MNQFQTKFGKIYIYLKNTSLRQHDVVNYFKKKSIATSTWRSKLFQRKKHHYVYMTQRTIAKRKATLRQHEVVVSFQKTNRMGILIWTALILVCDREITNIKFSRRSRVSPLSIARPRLIAISVRWLLSYRDSTDCLTWKVHRT